MWGFHDGMGWWMVFGGIWMLAFWALIIGLVVWGVSRITGGSARTRDDAPLEIAKKRLAGGEISREEYEELKKAL
ncbi:MAG: SHOCT domain-containing protein [Chloroflexi bacterium]|nr:SHOCT domain-containing protein [Chloroflexota bacterium]